MKTKLEQMSKEELIGEVMTLEIDKIFTEYVTTRRIIELKQEIDNYKELFKKVSEVDIAIIDAQGEDW
tara:strand:+ start:543 stop:746 length:204 start_codon:yes stop_codon:yes gene_type:complete